MTRNFRRGFRNIKRKQFVGIVSLLILLLGSVALSRSVLNPVGRPDRSSAATELAGKESKGLSAKLAQLSGGKVSVLVLMTDPQGFVKNSSEGEDIVKNSILIDVHAKSILDQLPANSYENINVMTTFPSFGADISLAALEKLKTIAEVVFIEEKVKLEPLLKEVKEQVHIVNTDTQQNPYGLSGAGTYVVVVDTGLDINTNENRLGFDAAETDFQICIGSNCPTGSIDGKPYYRLKGGGVMGYLVARMSPPCPQPGCDEHGNIVSDAIAGRPISNVSGGYAPGSKILPIKLTTYDEIVRAFDIVAQLNSGTVLLENGSTLTIPDNRFNGKIAAVNASLGKYVPEASTYCQNSILSQPVANLNNLGIFSVVTPGGQGVNERGPSANSISTPGCTPGVIIAGASTDKNSLKPELKGKELLGWETHRSPSFPNFIAAPAQNVRIVANMFGSVSPRIISDEALDSAPAQSFAAPLVASVLSLIKEASIRSGVNLNYNQIVELLANTGEPIIDEGYIKDVTDDGKDDWTTEDPYVTGLPTQIKEKEYPTKNDNSAGTIVWRGEFTVPQTGDYTFTVGSDDGARLWVNGERYIDKWVDRQYIEDTTRAITLETGKRYPIILAYYNSGGLIGQGKLTFSAKSSTGTVLPPTNFYPVGSQSGGGLKAQYYSKKANIYPRVDLKNALAKYYRDHAVLNDTTTACAITVTPANASITYSVCKHKPSGVLGISNITNEQNNPEVLQASTGPYANMVLVTVSYSPSAANKDAVVQLANFCGNPMTKVSSTAAAGGGMKTEMWYQLNPTSLDCEAYIQHTRPPGERVISTTIIINNVATTGTVVGTKIAGSVSTTYTINPTNVAMDLVGPKDSLMLCAYSHYSEQTTPPNVNSVTVSGITRQLWKYEPHRHLDLAGNPTSVANVWGGLVGGVQRTADNQSQTLNWRFAKTMPWSTMCANFKVKPFTAPPVTPPVTPPPAPPTPPPPAAPAVDLKVNSSNGPITIANNKSVLLTWTSSNASSCVASNAWTGTKTTAGTFTTPLLTANKTYTLTCTGPGGSKSDSVVVNVIKTPIVDLKINGSDTSVTFDKGIAPTLYWSQTGATSCTASGGWTGTKALAGGYEKGAVLGNSTSYTLTCTNASGSASDTVSVVATNNTALIGFVERYYSDTSFQQLVGQKVVTSINYDWGTTGVPIPGMSGNNYSSRWSAQITPQITGQYTFITTSDDGARLYIDDVAVINNWAYHGRTVDVGYINLVAGKQYDLVLEHVESTGGATMVFQAGIAPNPAALNPKAVALTLGSNGGGLTAEYFGTTTFTNPVATVREPVLETLWTTVPNSLLPATYKSARYSGTMVPTVSATYTFSIPNGVSMWINNVAKVPTSTGITHSMTANTAYDIRFETQMSSSTYFYVRAKYGTQPSRPLDFKTLRPVPGIQTQQPPQVVTGLKGTYFSKRDFTGTSITRVDPYIQFYWAGAAPATTIPNRDFSARWEGSLVVPTNGSYIFYIEADDGMRVSIDGKQIINKWTWESHYGSDQASTSLTLTAGNHSILVEYNQGTGGSKAILRWSGPGITKRVIQGTNLIPAN